MIVKQETFISKQMKLCLTYQLGYTYFLHLLHLYDTAKMIGWKH